MSEIDPDVRDLLDRQAILDCVYRTCRGLDRHDRELLSSCFHPDAIDNDGAFVGTTDEFVDWADKTLSEQTLSHSHNITSHNVEIDGDTAHADSYVIRVARCREDDGRTVTVAGSRYLDRFEKRDGTWRIALRRTVNEWRFVADGTVFRTPDGYPRGTWDRTDPSYQRPLRLPPEIQALYDAQKG